MFKIIIKTKLTSLIYKRAVAAAFFPFILVKNNKIKNNPRIINHELIHLRQQVELLILPFYILYIIEYLYGLIKYKNGTIAYLSISFEREARRNDDNLNYLKNRKTWAFTRYFNSV